MKRLLLCVDGVDWVCAHVAGFAILLIAAIQIVEILLRNILNVSLPFVWEYAAYFHIGAIFLAAAFALRTGGHIRVSLFARIMPRSLEVVATVLGLAISAFLSYALVMFAVGFGMSGRTSSTVNEVPLVWPAAVMAFGSVLFTLQLVLRVLRLATSQATEIAWGDNPDLSQ